MSYCSNSLSHKFVINAGGATILTNCNYNNPNTIYVNYLRILISSYRRFFKGPVTKTKFSHFGYFQSSVKMSP